MHSKEGVTDKSANLEPAGPSAIKAAQERLGEAMVEEIGTPIPVNLTIPDNETEKRETFQICYFLGVTSPNCPAFK